MIVSKREEAKQFSTASGVTNSILISGERMMFLLIELKPGSVIPLHSHPHEQMGICINGKVELQGGERTVVVESNTVWLFHSNERHGAKVVGKEGATLLEAFSPPREDYLARVSSDPRNI